MVPLTRRIKLEVTVELPIIVLNNDLTNDDAIDVVPTIALKIYLEVKAEADIVADANLFTFLIDNAVLEAVEDIVFNIPLLKLLDTELELIVVFLTTLANVEVAELDTDKIKENVLFKTTMAFREAIALMVLNITLILAEVGIIKEIKVFEIALPK